MPVLANRTRLQLSQSCGYNLNGADFFVGSTTSAGGNSTTVVDTKLRGGNDVFNSRWLRFISGTLNGEVSRVDDYVQSTTTITVAPAYSATVPSGASYELWLPEFQPARINEFLNQAILDTYGRAYNPVESLALHTGGGRQTSSGASSTIHRTGGFTRFDVPSGLSAIERIYYRESVNSQVIHECESAWNESVGASLTAAADTEIKWRGNSSMKVTVAAGAAANVLITDNIASLNISGKTHVEFWCRSNIATVASDIHLLLDDTAACASPVETLALPALVANTDTFVRVALANPQSDTAIISVGVRFTTDNGAQTFWIDDVQVVNHDTAIWQPVSRRGWRLEKDAGDIILTDEARTDIGYALLKLVGGDAPALLSADSDVNEIDDNYVICRATELAFSSAGSVKDYYKEMALTWAARAATARKSLHRLRSPRKVA